MYLISVRQYVIMHTFCCKTDFNLSYVYFEFNLNLIGESNSCYSHKNPSQISVFNFYRSIIITFWNLTAVYFIKIHVKYQFLNFIGQ